MSAPGLSQQAKEMRERTDARSAVRTSASRRSRWRGK
jgi:hypothetical protein